MFLEHQYFIAQAHAEEKEPEFIIYGVEDLPGLNFTNSLGMEFVYIEPGSFMMGSPLDEPKRDNDEKQHQVTLTKGYYIQTTEVTQGQWKAIMGDNPSRFSNCGDNCPVERVSWNDVQEFIRKLNSQKGDSGHRLPTEAEWEYACRVGTKTPFSFGKCLSTEQANYNGKYPMPKCSKGQNRGKTIPVASFEPNAWGLYDMHGNVYEWCQDWYGAYPSGSVTDPVCPTSGSTRVLRGGCWFSHARFCRSAFRLRDGPGDRDGYGYYGFRLVLPSGQ
jgi:formylglycine-generating enzyme required for sulfatase activity